MKRGHRGGGRARFVSTRLLANHGAIVHYRHRSNGSVRRWVPPSGRLTVREAAGLLRIQRVAFYRLVATGRIHFLRGSGPRMVSLATVRALRRGEL